MSRLAWLKIGVPISATMFSVGCGSAAVELMTLSPAKIVVSTPPPPDPVVEEDPPPTGITVTDSKVEIDQKIAFQSWKAEILDESTSILDEIARVLQENPKITRIEIQGHTAEAPNRRRLMKLSKQRAEAVRAYLIQQGIDPQRLSAKGYGATRPIADNESPEGREQNRRVEFVILERSQHADMVANDDGSSDE